MICPACKGIGLDEKYEGDRDITDYDGAARCMTCRGYGDLSGVDSVADYWDMPPPLPAGEWQAAVDRCVALGLLSSEDEALLRALEQAEAPEAASLTRELV